MNTKKIILIVALAATSLAQKTFAQEASTLSFQIVINSYFGIKNQLTKDDADSVRAYAKNLSASVKDITVEKLSPEQNNIWIKYSEVLISDASKIGSARDIKTQRTLFTSLSSNFYKMISAMKVNTADLYYQYCPMANAYWVSENSKIINPYYGKQMLSCGSTKETLKVNK